MNNKYDQYDYDKNMYQYHLERSDFFKRRLQKSQMEINKIIMQKHNKKQKDKLSKKQK